MTTDLIKIYNTSKQAVRLQLRPPGGDFYATEQQVSVNPGQVVTLPKSHLIQEQVDNLQRRQMLRVLYDGEK